MATPFIVKLFVSVMVVAALRLLFRLYNAVVAQPRKLRYAMRSQGLSGPPPTFLLGNIPEIKKVRAAATASPAIPGPPASHNCGAALLPFVEEWRKQYGDVFVFSIGSTQIVHVTQPEVVREITTCTLFELGKPTYQAEQRGPLLGRGILTSNGPQWHQQWKILAPELYIDKVKGMVELMQDSSVALVESWKKLVKEGGGLADIKVDQYLRSFSGDVISKACFSSNYSKGEEIFSRLRALQEVSSKKSLATEIPGMRHLPTKNNREAWALEKEIKMLILDVVKERDEGGFKKDLLQMVLKGARNSGLSKNKIDRFVVDNCKNIYLAGYETAAVTAAWCLMLLASNPKWQLRIRDEVVHVTKGQIPDYEAIKKMKLLGMAINETLRLYPPVSVVSREAFKDMKFGNLNVTKGMNLWILVTTLHTDPNNWGSDSYEFNPDRFANGIAGACKLPHLYLPFGFGPRSCIGQHLAQTELKMVISLILSNFSFTLSPKYVHSPTLNLVAEPRFGVNLSIKEL